MKSQFINVAWQRRAWDGLFAKAYDRIAKDLTEGLYVSLRETFETKVFPELPRESLVLDAGCGPGHFLARLARDVPEATVLGFDLSATMLGLAAATRATSGLRRCHLIQGDIHHLPFADGSVDLVLSTTSLKYWADPVACLNEMHRVGKPHATIVLVEMNPEATKEEKDFRKLQLAQSLPGRPIQKLVRKWVFEHLLLANSPSLGQIERIARTSNFSDIDLGTVPGYPFLRVIMKKTGAPRGHEERSCSSSG